MTSEKAIELLERQIERITELNGKSNESPEFQKWRRDTLVVLKNIFGADAGHLGDFTSISFSQFTPYPTTPAEDREPFLKGLGSAKSLLESMVDEIREFGVGDESLPSNSTISLEQLLDKFPRLARQLRERHGQRTTLEIDDEYDVQDLLHALLHLISDDIRPEESSPSCAGGSSRIDFLLKKEETLVEVKKTRKGLAAKEVGDQLLIDIGRYQAHPNCKRLVCFVYDPEFWIKNPVALERDLTKTHGNLPVTVIIAPKGN
jgi:hypothetical protein